MLGFSLLGETASAQEMERAQQLPVPLQKVDTLFMQGRSDAANSILETYLQQNPNSIQALIRKSRVQGRNGNYAQAESTLKKALTISPKNVDVLEAMGRLYYRQSTASVSPKNNLEKSEFYLEQALAINPNHVPSISTLGLVRLAQKDQNTAERLLRQALSLSPTNSQALQGLARFYIQIKDWTNARYAVNQALELDPNNADLYFLAAQLLAVADFPADSIQYAKKSESLDFGKNLDRDFLIATQYEKLGEPANAIPYHEKIVKEYPNHKESWQHLGALYAANNQSDKSRSAYKVAIKLDPSWFESLKTNVIQTMRQGNSQGLIPQIEHIIAIQPELAAQYEPLVSNIQYALGLLQASKQTSASAPMPLEQLPIGQSQSMGDVKRTFGRAGYVAGFVLPSETNGDKVVLSLVKNDIERVEAEFLVGHFQQAKTLLEEQSDSFSGDEYAFIGDRLFLLRNVKGAQVAYQRAMSIYRMDGIASSDIRPQSIGMVLQQIDKIAQQSERTIAEGDRYFDQKNYQKAALSYLNSLQLNPGNESAYLRLADTLPRIKLKKKEAPLLPITKYNLPTLSYWAFYQATQMNPSLMDSKGFSKDYLKSKTKGIPTTK